MAETIHALGRPSISTSTQLGDWDLACHSSSKIISLLRALPCHYQNVVGTWRLLILEGLSRWVDTHQILLIQPQHMAFLASVLVLVLVL
jgi:hypothetical protein